MKPMTGCALLGANRALSGISDAVILQHSVIGCNWGSLVSRYAYQPYDIRQASTVIYEENVIYGGDMLLEKGIREIDTLYPQAKAVFVISGCVPNMIGDDVESVLEEMQPDTDKILLHVPAAGYMGDIESGMERAWVVLLRLMQDKGKTAVPSINIIGIASDDPYGENDVNVISKSLGYKVQINCSLNSCTTGEIAAMPSAWLNVVFGSGVQLALAMERKFGVPYIICNYPYGIHVFCEFLCIIGKKLGVDFSDEIAHLETAGKKIVRKAAYYLSNLYQLPAAVVGDSTHLNGMAEFLSDELGMDVVIKINKKKEYDMNALEEKINTLDPVLLLGSTAEKIMSIKFNIPFVRYVYPVLDEVCLGASSMVGAEGTAFLLEKIINSSLQCEYKHDGIYKAIRSVLRCKDADK